MDKKFPPRWSFPGVSNRSSSTSTDEIDPSHDDTQDSAVVSDERGGHFWQRGPSQTKLLQRARAEEALQALGLPSGFMERTLDALPLGKFDKLLSGDPPPLRIIHHPGKPAALSWSNGALSDSMLDAIVDVCHALFETSTVLLAETFAEPLLDIVLQASIPTEARGRLLKWCSRFMVYRSVMDLPPERSLSLMFECKNLFTERRLPKREYFQMLNRLVGVIDAEGYGQLSLERQIKLITALVKAWTDTTTKPAVTGWRKQRREQLAQHIETLHGRALEQKDERSAQRTLVLMQTLHRTGTESGGIRETFKGILEQAGERRAQTKFRDKGRAVERCLVIIKSDDGDLVAKPVPGEPPLEAKRLLNYLFLSTEAPSRLLWIDMVPYIAYGRQHFKHVFTPAVVCRLWLAHAHSNPQDRSHILKGILSTGGVPLGRAFEDLAKWHAEEFDASIAQALITILGGEQAGQSLLVMQTSILRAIVEISQIVGLSSSLKLTSVKSSPNPLPPFCATFLISDGMASQLRTMLGIMREAADQEPTHAFERWISLSMHGQQSFRDDDRWPLLHAQLTHAMLVHVLARGDIKNVYEALMRLARNGLLPGKSKSVHALVASFLSEALADEEIDATKLSSWAAFQVRIDRLLKLSPSERHEAHMTLGAFHAAMSLATGSDSPCGESEIAEVYKHIVLVEIHAADGNLPVAVDHLESAVTIYISGRKHWGARAAKYEAAAASDGSEQAQHILDFCRDPKQPGFMFDPDRRLIKALLHRLNAIAAMPVDDDELRERVRRLRDHELE
jgi:hypothetical protein